MAEVRCQRGDTFLTPETSFHSPAWLGSLLVSQSPSGSGPSSLLKEEQQNERVGGKGRGQERRQGGGGRSRGAAGRLGGGHRRKRHRCSRSGPSRPQLGPCPPGAAMSEVESKDSSGSECPVCYENRTLSCGHVFCHDCLVKYLLSTRVDGQVQRTIVCPVCRYVTFLSKKSSRWPSMLDKSSQTLACHHRMPWATPTPWPSPSLQGGQLPLDLPPSLPREPQIFIISRHGMPLGEQESILPRRSLAELSEASPAPSSTRSFCCRSRALLLITLITVVAVVAAILPWVLLVRKQAQAWPESCSGTARLEGGSPGHLPTLGSPLPEGLRHDKGQDCQGQS
ncbi:RING finger protein 222 [Camelus dromedarius]|uniref:RING finger protein 222 n=1 Tax=Camelus dromedarius TaxID=9838 RepID=A0A5N4D5R7_CAMDR|nr:RING finger protein 222 [Camelus dromedarius]